MRCPSQCYLRLLHRKLSALPCQNGQLSCFLRHDSLTVTALLSSYIISICCVSLKRGRAKIIPIRPWSSRRLGLCLMSMLNVVRKSMKPWKTAVLIQLLLIYASHKAASGSKIDWQPSASSCIPWDIPRKFFAILDVTSYIWAQPQCNIS